MTVKELFDIVPNNKKELLSELDSKNITWKYNQRTIVLDDVILDGCDNVKVVYNTYYNRILSVRIYFDKDNYSITQVKEIMIGVFGIPRRDNSKHKLDNVTVHWNYNNRHMYLNTSNTDKNIVLTYLFPTEELIKDNNKYTFIISMIGGVVWGILFFIFFGLTFEYSWILFVVSMIGGILWGLIFALCILKISNFGRKQISFDISERDKRIFSNYEKTNKITSEGTYCVVSNYLKRRHCFYKAKIYINEKSFTILLLDKKNIKQETKEFKNIKRYEQSSLYKNIIIYFHNSPSVYLSNIGNVGILTNMLDKVLGYDTIRFSKIDSIVFNNLVLFDPEDILAGGASKEIFIEGAKSVAMEIYNKKTIDVNVIQFILKRNFNTREIMGFIDFDLLSLAIDIYDDLQKNNLIENDIKI